MNKYIFFLIFFTLFLSIHLLYYNRVIKNLLVGDTIKRLFAILISINFIFNILYVFGRYSDLLPNGLYYIFSISIGVTFVLLLYTIIHEILHAFHKNITTIDSSKRRFIKQSGDGALMALSTAYIAIGTYEGSKEPVVKVVKAKLFDFSIVQISDFHIGGLIDRAFVKHSVSKINSLKPDIVVITGDLIDTDIDYITDAVLELNGIVSKYGVYMILGNHEYFHNPMKIIEFLRRETHIEILLNDSVTIEELKVNIVGVTDIFGYRTNILPPDALKAFADINREYPTILLAHQPKYIEYLGSFHPELILSGHTHGGQIWPFNHLVRLQQPFLKGLHTLPYGGKIYINSGIGFWGPPMRLGSEAEISYII